MKRNSFEKLETDNLDFVTKTSSQTNLSVKKAKLENVHQKFD